MVFDGLDDDLQVFVWNIEGKDTARGHHQAEPFRLADGVIDFAGDALERPGAERLPFAESTYHCSGKTALGVGQRGWRQPIVPVDGVHGQR